MAIDTRQSRLAAMDAEFVAFIKECNANCPFASRDDRKRRAKELMDYLANSGKEYTGPMICSSLDADHPPLLNGNWLGIKWVALHGIDSLCVVALKNDLVRLEYYVMQFERNKIMTTSTIWNALVNEVEGIEDRFFQGSCKRPFSVVAAISDTSETHGSREWAEAQKTSKFLQKEMKSDATFTFDKTMQTAISAFQHLLCRKLQAHDIRVFAWKDGDSGEELEQWRENPDLEEVLAHIREPDNVDPDTFTPKKGKKQLPRRVEFHPVNFQEVGLRRYFREGQGDCLSRLSRKRKASEKATHPKEGRESRDERRQRRKNVRKSSSKAMKETRDALLTKREDEMIAKLLKLEEEAEMKEQGKRSVSGFGSESLGGLKRLLRRKTFSDEDITNRMIWAV